MKLGLSPAKVLCASIGRREGQLEVAAHLSASGIAALSTHLSLGELKARVGRIARVNSSDVAVLRGVELRASDPSKSSHAHRQIGRAHV